MADLRFDRVRFTPARPEEWSEGLLGWVCLRLDRRWQVDGIAARRTADGRFTLSFPSKRDATGNLRHYLRPVDQATRLAIETQVLAAIKGDLIALGLWPGGKAAS